MEPFNGDSLNKRPNKEECDLQREKEVRGRGTRKGLAELPNMIIQKYNGMCSNTKWKGNDSLLGEAVGQIHCCTPCEGYAVLHLSCFISMALHPCLSHHIPHFRSSSDNGHSCYPLQINLCKLCSLHVTPKLVFLVPYGKAVWARWNGMELFPPRSIMKQDHRALVMRESLGAAGTGTDGSSAKPDWKISRQSSNPN